MEEILYSSLKPLIPKLKICETNLDSSVGIQFQYRRSSIPVIAIAFAEIDMQTLPVTLSSHTSCKYMHRSAYFVLIITHNQNKKALKRKKRGGGGAR